MHKDNADYLQSKEWMCVRRMVLDRAGGLCEARLRGCRGEAAQVLHDDCRYWGNEPLWTLRAVCLACYDEIKEMDSGKQ